MKRITDEQFTQIFSSAIGWLNGPANTGLRAIVMTALVVWRANAVGATRRQIEQLIFRDSSKKTHFNGGLRLARIWNETGLPEEIRAAKSDEAALSAGLYWLATRHVCSQEDFHILWTGMKPNRPRTQVDRLSAQVAAAIRSGKAQPWSYEYSASDFATAIVEQLELDDARVFCMAAEAALQPRELNRADEDAGV